VPPLTRPHSGRPWRLKVIHTLSGLTIDSSAPGSCFAAYRAEFVHGTRMQTRGGSRPVSRLLNSVLTTGYATADPPVIWQIGTWLA